MFALPWTRDTVPHAVIELTRDCNLACRACYRKKEPGMRTVAEVLQDVEIIEKHQRVHTISLAGGEPTLHPELPEIVRRVKARGHCVSLVTNAVLLDDAMLSELAAAGLDIVMIHVDEGQTRPDLPENAGITALNALREQIAARVCAHGITAGLCTTLYPESLANLPALVSVFLNNPDINFLFATHAVAIPELVARSAGGATVMTDHATCCGTSNRGVMESLRQAFGLEPYAYIAPAAPMPDGELPCITYSVPVAHRTRPRFLRMKSGRMDRALVQASRLIAGRYLYFTPNRVLPNALQILFNGLGSGRPLRALAFLIGAIGAPLRMKRLVFENAPRITAGGTVNCCDFCPNSTVRDGAVVPVCLADHRAELNL
ncbi:MAG: radical SAM protein [Kiritimatiellia bacterium]|jgi:hypothetical protein